MDSMEPKIKPTERATYKTDAPGSITTANSTTEQIWAEYVEPIWETIMAYVANIPDYIGQFFSSYKRPLLVLGGILAGFVTIKVMLAVLDAIDDIPLLAPILQLIGIGYTAWFIWRYLWKDSNRRELVAEIDTLKAQIFGDEPRI